MNKISNQEQIQLAQIEAAKHYLNDVKTLRRKVELAEIEYKAAVEKSSGLKGIDYSKDRVSTSPTDSAIHNAVELYLSRLEELESLKSISEEVLEECFTKLEQLDIEEATILRLHFFLGLSHNDIALSLYISRPTVFRKYNNGLLSLYQNGLPAEYRLNYQQAV